MSEDTTNLREKLLNNAAFKNSDAPTNFLSENPQPDPPYEEKSSNMILNKECSDFSDAKNFKFDNLSKLNVWGYGLGHFINDLAAAGWFNYLTIYLKSINPIDTENAGFYAG